VCVHTCACVCVCAHAAYVLVCGNVLCCAVLLMPVCACIVVGGCSLFLHESVLFACD